MEPSSLRLHGTPAGMPRNEACARLRRRYDELWSATIGRIRAGKIESDLVLEAGVPDRRRGLTVVARPALEVRRNVAALLGKLRRLEPEQYYYTRTEFHITVLSLFTATVDTKPFFARRRRYVAAVDAALEAVAPIRIAFEGITGSPGTVMIQGFFETDALNDLRDTLRWHLRDYGLAEGLDQRYRLETAHMTVLRFRSPLRDPERFASVLEHARQQALGTTTIRCLTLVENDWYMSRRATRTLKRYRLARMPL